MNNLIKYIFIAVVFSGISYAYYFETHSFVFRIISFLGTFVFYIILIVYALLYLKQKKKVVVKPLLLIWYIIATLIILVTSLRVNLNDIITLVFHPLAFSAFFIGIIAFLINKSSLLFIVKMSRNINNIIPLITMFDILIFKYPILLITCHAFILFEYNFVSQKRKSYLHLLMLLSLPIFLIYDHRSGIVLTISFFIIIFSIYFFKIFRSKFIRVLFLAISFTLICFITFNFTEVFQFITTYFTGDLINATDTRSFLFLEFFNDFKPSEYLLGRGYLGTYYSVYFENWDGDSSNRFVVEVGFLQLLFKGGGVLLGLTVLIFIKSIFNGLFKNKPGSLNFLLGLWLIIELAMFAVQNIPEFSPHFFIMWIIIGILNYQKPKEVKHVIS